MKVDGVSLDEVLKRSVVQSTLSQLNDEIVSHIFFPYRCRFLNKLDSQWV